MVKILNVGVICYGLICRLQVYTNYWADLFSNVIEPDCVTADCKLRYQYQMFSNILPQFPFISQKIH